MPLTDEASDLRQKLTHAEAVIAELRGDADVSDLLPDARAARHARLN